jgi:hypothetical protein
MDTIRHRDLAISAPKNYWVALGNRMDGENDKLLMLALAAGHRDEAAITWALAERQRREEAYAIAHAINSEAASLQSLANAIRGANDDATLEKLLGRLTERTRYAVRAQLAQSGR